MLLQGVLDTEVHAAVKIFLNNGIPPRIDALYTAIQKSNSSLKRRPKKALERSLERVLEFIDVQQPRDEKDDSEAETEKRSLEHLPDSNIMNKALRANLNSSAQSNDVSSPTANGEDGQRKRRMANGEPLSKRQRSDKPVSAAPTDISLDDVGGMDDVIDQLGDQLIVPLGRPEKYEKMRLRLPRGILLHGPPGCGKTMLVRAYAAELQLPFLEILGPSIVSGMSGESEKGVREKFEEAKRNAPCLLFIDEIDAIAPKRESSQSQMEKRIVAQLLVSMDEVGRDYSKPVVVLAATNRPDSLDPALRRGGRFDTEINIGVPNERVRESILRAQTRETPVAGDVDFAKLARATPGFVGADLHDLVAKAGTWQIQKYREALTEQSTDLMSDLAGDVESKPATKSAPKVVQKRRLISRLKRRDLPEPVGFENIEIPMMAFEAVLPSIIPSSKREGFATIPDVSWEDVGALQTVRKELQAAIVNPIQSPAVYASFGLTSPAGVLLWGPPGCGKTLLAKAAAAESKANFISIKGPELLNKFVGESEASVRRVFTRARSSVPCVIFFDEVDALAAKRDEGSSEASNRVVNTLLAELDGLDQRAGIYVIGATNRPDVIDPAMIRPGRLEIPLFVDLPGYDERVEIAKTLLRGKSVDDLDEILTIIKEECEGFSGADLEALIRASVHCAIDRRGTRLEGGDFRRATNTVTRSVQDIKQYYALKKRFGQRG